MHILIIEDERKTAAFLNKGLSESGFVVDTEENGGQGLLLALSKNYDLLILDVMLPGRDGWSILSTLRQSGNQIPVLFLTARDTVQDRVKGLELGADDYLTKPFSPRELVARVRAVLRRADRTTAIDPGAVDLVRAGDLTLDVPRMRTDLAGRSIDLTPTEFTLLATLARQPGRIFTRSQLLDALHGIAFESYERAIDSHVKNLRRKLEPEPRQPRYVLTVYGVGYRFADDREDGA